jgi:tetratricopeptide (TPR) repeat protein
MLSLNSRKKTPILLFHVNFSLILMQNPRIFCRMKKFLLTLFTIFLAYYCAYITSGASEKQSLFNFGNSRTLYKIKCAISGETDTTDAKALYYRGEEFLNNKQYDLALRDMEKVLSIDSVYVLARLTLAKIYLGLNDTVSAIKVLLKHVQINSEPAEGYMELGNIFKSKGLSDSSFYYYKKSFDAHNAYPQANFEIANYYCQSSKYNDALDYLNRAIENDEYNLVFRNLRRIIYLKINNSALAEQDYQFIKNQNSEFFGNYKEKAEKEKNLGNFQAAVENYKLAIQELGESRELLESKAWVYHSLSKYDSAFIDFKRVCEIYPDYLSFFNVAYTLDLLDSVKESLGNYNKSIELKDDYYLSYNNRGYENYRLKKLKEAQADYTKSIDLKEDYFLSHYNRGLLYYETKKYAKAIIDYKNALKYAENGLEINYSLALAYDKLKNKEEAIVAYNDFLKLAKETDSIRIIYANQRIADLGK